MSPEFYATPEFNAYLAGAFPDGKGVVILALMIARLPDQALLGV